MGASKPAPEIFHAALRHARAEPAEAVHVGDHLLDDIEGASGVGMHTIWVNLDRAEPPPEAARPSQVVHHMEAVPDTVTLIRDSLK